MKEHVHLGFEVGTGKPVDIPILHTCVTGQTQLAGKTTTLEALIQRSGRRAIAFVTKRGEGAFREARSIPPYFREHSDWQFVRTLLESTLREKMAFKTPWIMRVCEGARSLKEVQRNLIEKLKTSKGMNQDMYLTLSEYMKIVVPQIDRLPYTNKIELEPGLNVMDLEGYSAELQALVIASTLEWVYEHEEGVITIVPEAWEFLPQQRNSPVKRAAEMLSRKGAGLKNFLWLDSQDISGVDKNMLHGVGVWILGVQREAHEVKRSLNHLPHGTAKPKPDQILTLGKGEFYLSYGKELRKVYVQPAWASEDEARFVAEGYSRASALKPPPPKPKPQPPIVAPTGRGAPIVMHKESEDQNLDYKAAFEEQKERADQLERKLGQLRAAAPVDVKRDSAPHVARQLAPATGANGDFPEELYQQFRNRLRSDPEAVYLLAKLPTIEIKLERPTITTDLDSAEGQLYKLLTEGFFEMPRTVEHLNTEFRRRAWMAQTGRPIPLNLCLSRMAKAGFITIEANGLYQAIPGAAKRVREVSA